MKTRCFKHDLYYCFDKECPRPTPPDEPVNLGALSIDPITGSIEIREAIRTGEEPRC